MGALAGRIPEVGLGMRRRPLLRDRRGALSQTNIGVDASGPAVLANGSVMLRSNALLTSLAWSGPRSAVMK